MSTPAPRDGVGGAGPLAEQEAAAVAASATDHVFTVWRTTGEDGFVPSQDRTVLAATVGDEAR